MPNDSGVKHPEIKKSRQVLPAWAFCVIIVNKKK